MTGVAVARPRRTKSAATRSEGAAVAWSSALLGGLGSSLLALASNLPGSPYGPVAGGLWPLAVKGPAPGWEGPVAPWWAKVANSGPQVPPGRVLTTALAVSGVVLLWVAWARLWRSIRNHGSPGWWTLSVIAGAWALPMFFAAPFASQDVWIYGAQGKMVLSGISASRPETALGHSAWLSGVDPKWAARAPIYGPGSLDLSAFFVKISAGRPWVAAECWRAAAAAGVLLSAWGVARAVARSGRNAASAVVGGVLNPGVLIVFVASIHNDSLMVGLVAAGIALALSGRTWWAIGLCAAAVTIKAPAALAVLAIAWWGWKPGWRGRAEGVIAGAVVCLGALVATGLSVGGAFDWVKSASLALLTSSFSVTGGLLGVTSGSAADAVQIAGVVLAVLLVVRARRAKTWPGGLAFGFLVMAVCAVNPQPWYVPWAAVFLAFVYFGESTEAPIRIVTGVLVAMMAWSEMPLGTLVWFLGLVVVAWFAVTLERQWRAETTRVATTQFRSLSTTRQ